MVCCYLLALMSILSGTTAYNKLKISFVVFYFNSEIEILLVMIILSIPNDTIAYNDSSKLKISFVFYFNSEIEILPVNLL